MRSRSTAIEIFDTLVEAGFIATLSGGIHGDTGEHYSIAVRVLTLRHAHLLELLHIAERVNCEVAISSGEVRLIPTAE